MSSVTVKEVLDTAVMHHQNGAYEKALNLYAQLVRKNIIDKNILNLKALAEKELEFYEEAEKTVDQLLALDISTNAYFLNTVGLVYKANKRYNEALLIFNQVLTLSTDNADYYNNAANVFFELKEWVKAGHLYVKAIQLNPKLLQAYENLSSAHIKTNNYVQAEKTLDYALQSDLVSENLLANRIASLVKDDQFEKCERYHDELLTRYGWTDRVVNSKIKILIGKEEWDKLKKFVRNLKLEKFGTSAQLNAAYAETLLGFGGRAEMILKKYISSRSELPENLFGLVSWMRACINLRKGKLIEAWKHYIHRHKWDDFSSEIINLSIPRLTLDNDLEGKKILLFREQGVGDEIMFLSLLPRLLNVLPDSCTVELHCSNRLVGLFSDAFPGILIRKLDWENVKQIKTDGGYDYYGYIGDIPCILNMSLDSFRPEPYLKFDPDKVRYFKGALSLCNRNKMVIGLSWRSGFSDKARDIHYTGLNDWIPLLESDETQIVCLQYSDISADLEALPSDVRDKLIIPPIDLKNDFQDLSAVMINCDLVISPMNAVVMQASNLGVSTVSYLLKGDNYAFGEDKEEGLYDYPWFSDNNTMHCFDKVEGRKKVVDKIISNVLENCKLTKNV